MSIKRINSDNTDPYIAPKEIIEIHKKIINDYKVHLKSYGVKAQWNDELEEITEDEIYRLPDKQLQLIFLYKYKKCFVHKDLVSKFVRKYKVNSALDQQVRHLGTQDLWYVLNKNAPVPDTDEVVPSGYNILFSTELPNPKAISAALKRMGRVAAHTFEEIKIVYDNKCVTCGMEEGKKDYRTNQIVKLQQGHMNPNKKLDIDNTIPQCEYCNQTYKDYFIFDENGRIVELNNPEFLIKSTLDVKKAAYELLEKELKGKKS